MYRLNTKMKLLNSKMDKYLENKLLIKMMFNLPVEHDL